MEEFSKNFKNKVADENSLNIFYFKFSILVWLPSQFKLFNNLAILFNNDLEFSSSYAHNHKLQKKVEIHKWI